MAITYVGGVQGGRAGSTATTTQSLSGTLTGGTNTSPSAGDLVVVWCAAAADTTAAPNQFVSGNNNGAYSTETQQAQLGTTYDAYAALNWKIQGSTVDTTITIPSSGSIRNAQRWVVHVFRGVSSTTPWDATSTTASGTASGRPNPPSITPVNAGAWILWLGHSAAATGTAYTAPTDFSADWLGGTTVDTADCMIGAGYYTGWTSGAYDPAAITAGGTTNAADAWVAKTAVLRPQKTLTADNGSFALNGQAATLKKGIKMTAGQGSFALNGQAVTLQKGRTMAAGHGSFALSGQAATLARGRHIDPAYGAFTLTGQAATLKRGYVMPAVYGSFALSGQDIHYHLGKNLTAGHGSFTLSGQDIATFYGKHFDVTHGSFSLSGQAVTLTYVGPAFELALSSNITDGGATTAQLTAPSGKTTSDFAAGEIIEATTPSDAIDLAADKYTELEFSIVPTADAELGETYQFRVVKSDGTPLDTYTQTPEWFVGAGVWAENSSFTLSGQAASPKRGLKLTAQYGAFTLTGQDVTLRYGKHIDPVYGSFTLSGQAVSTEYGRRLVAGHGSFALSGQNAILDEDEILHAGQGSFTLAGQDATLTYTENPDLTMSADYGSFALSGQTVTLKRGIVANAGHGSFSLSGQDVTTRYGKHIDAGHASFAYVGQDGNLVFDHRLYADWTQFYLNEQDVTLTRGSRTLMAGTGYFRLTLNPTGRPEDRILYNVSSNARNFIEYRVGGKYVVYV